MSVIIKSSIVPVVTISGTGKPVASSLDVAEAMGKRHGSIIRSIRQLDCSSDFRKHHFVFSKYKTPENRRGYPICEMTREGFSLLMSDLGSPAAMRFMESYINEFSRMEAALQAAPAPVVPAAVPALPDFTNPAIAARAWADQFERAEDAERVNGRLLAFPESLGVTEAAKILKLPPRQLSAMLLDWKWTYIKRGRKRNKTLAYQSIIDRGLMVHDAFEADDGRVHYHPKITPEGMGTIARILPDFS